MEIGKLFGRRHRQQQQNYNNNIIINFAALNYDLVVGRWPKWIPWLRFCAPLRKQKTQKKYTKMQSKKKYMRCVKN